MEVSLEKIARSLRDIGRDRCPPALATNCSSESEPSHQALDHAAATVWPLRFSFIVGWLAPRSRHSDFNVHALEMSRWARKVSQDGLLHHSDREVQYLSIRYSERLADVGVVTSVGSRGD